MDVGYGKDLYIIIVCRREISERSRSMPDGMLVAMMQREKYFLCQKAEEIL